MEALKKFFGIPPAFGFSMTKKTWNVIKLDDSTGQVGQLMLRYVGTVEEVKKIEKAIKCAIYSANN
jgi:hypothetical protein